MQQRSILERVIDCLEQTTRYPRALLTPEAHLADDLGIDSVKQVEVVVAVEAAFGIRLERAQAAGVNTVADIAAMVSRAAPAAGGPAPKPAAAPVVMTKREAAPIAVPKRDVAPIAAAPREVPPAVAAPKRDIAPVAATSTRPEPQAPRTLENRVIWITGSGRGLGRTVAEVLSRRGASVVINSFHSREAGERTAADIQAMGGKAIHVWGSVAKADHVERMAGEIEDQLGGIDALVCNASDGRIGAFLDLTYDDWDRAFRTNVTGHHACARRAAMSMAARGGGSIVTMSALGAHAYVRGLGSQGVVKAAVETLTRYLACELAPQNIRVNCVSAGPVYGPLLDQLAETRVTQAHWEAMTPGGALCDPLDIAKVIAFLVSDDATGINGAIWPVDNGMSAHADGRMVSPGIEGLAQRLRVAS